MKLLRWEMDVRLRSKWTGKVMIGVAEHRVRPLNTLAG